MSQQQFMSRQEAAALLGVTVAVVDRLIATGALPRYRIGGVYVRVRERDVDLLADVPREWLRNC